MVWRRFEGAYFFECGVDACCLVAKKRYATIVVVLYVGYRAFWARQGFVWPYYTGLCIGSRSFKGGQAALSPRTIDVFACCEDRSKKEQQ